MYNFSRKPPYSIISVRQGNFSQIINRPKFSRNLVQRHNQDRLTTSNVNSEFLKRILNQNEVKYICNFCCVDDFKRRFKLFKEKSGKQAIFKTFKRSLHSNTSHSAFSPPRIRLAKWSIDEVNPLENHEKQLKQPQPTEWKLTKKPQKQTTSLKPLSTAKIPKIGLNKLFKQLKSLSEVPVPIETKKSIMLKPRIKKKLKVLKPQPKPLKHGSKTKSVIRTKTAKELKNENLKCTAKWMDKPGLTMSSKPKQLEKLTKKKLKPSKIKSASKRKRTVDIDNIEKHKVSKSTSNRSLKADEPIVEYSKTNKIDHYSVKWPYKQNIFPDNYSYQLAGSTKSWSINDNEIRTRYGINKNKTVSNKSDEDSEDIGLKPVDTAWVYKHLSKPFSKHKAYSLSNSLAKWSFKPDSLNSPVLSIEDGNKKNKSGEKEYAENKKDVYLPEMSEHLMSKKHKIVTTSSVRRKKMYPPLNELSDLRKSKSEPNWSTELVLPTNNVLCHQQQYYDSSRYPEESNSIRSFKPLPSDFKDREKFKYISEVSDETPETIRRSIKLHKTRAEKSTETDNSMQWKKIPSKITNIASFVLRKKREEQLIAKQKKVQEQCRRMNRKKSKITVDDGPVSNLYLISQRD